MKKKILALIVLLTLVLAVFAGCSTEVQTVTMNIDDYMLKQDMEFMGVSVKTNNVLPTQLKALEYSPSSINVQGLAVVRDADNGYGLYDIHEGTFKAIEGATSITPYNNLFIVNNGTTDPIQRAVYSLDGSLLIDFGEYSAFKIRNSYMYKKGEITPSYVYTVSYTYNEETVEKYYVADNAFRLDTAKLTEINVEDYEQTPGVSGVDGGYVYGALQSVYSYSSPEVAFIMNGDYARYRMVLDSTSRGSVGNFVKNRITLFNGVAVMDTININYGRILGAVGKYLYYSEATVLSPDSTKGYNLVVGSTQQNAVKYNEVFYRYDLTTQKIEQVKLAFHPLEVETNYNYTTNVIDALTVTAMNYNNGYVVYDNSYSAYNVYMVNEEFKIGFDFSNKPFYFAEGNCYKLNDNAYLIKGTNYQASYIINKDFNIISSLDIGYSVSVDYAESMLICNSSTSSFAVGFDGKLLVDKTSTALNFYGGYAYDNTSGMLFSKSNPDGTELDLQTYADDASVVVAKSGLILVYSSSNRECYVLNYKGDLITTINDVTSRYSLSIDNQYNTVILTATTSSGTVTYLVS